MLDHILHDGAKKARYVKNFLARKLVHTNIQILYRCNFRCQICEFWRDSHKERAELSLDQVRVIADQLARIGPQVISIGGGEPLLHRDIVDIVRVLAHDHFPVMICNGWYMTPAIARALFSAGMYEISVSVDYADPARHDEQRGVKGAWQRAVDALRILHENRTRPEHRVHMISVIMEDNLDDVEPLIQLCQKIGVTYLLTLYSTKRGVKEPRAAGWEVSPRLLQLKKKYPRDFVVLRNYVASFSKAIHQNGIGGCRCGKNLCNIDSQGEVSLCIDRIDDPVGNILTDDVQQIEQRLLAMYESNSCQDCWTSCRGAIETMMYGRDRAANLWDYFQLTRPVPLGARADDAFRSA